MVWLIYLLLNVPYRENFLLIKQTLLQEADPTKTITTVETKNIVYIPVLYTVVMEPMDFYCYVSFTNNLLKDHHFVSIIAQIINKIMTHRDYSNAHTCLWSEVMVKDNSSVISS